MNNTNNKCCLLCGREPEAGMHVTGQKKIKGKSLFYQLCKECCTVDNTNSDGQTSRKKMWSKVEKKLSGACPKPKRNKMDNFFQVQDETFSMIVKSPCNENNIEEQQTA